MLLGAFACYFGFGNRQLIPLHSAWSPMQADGSVPGFAAEQMLPAVSSDQELVEMLQNLEEFPFGMPAVQPNENGKWRVVRMKVTAYCPCRKCCGRHADGITACNHRIRLGDVFAAADKRYAFETEMIVPGYNGNQPIQVKDRGRLIKGNRLDVFFHSHQQAQKWGVKTLEVLVKAE
jgi:3D (Asp-Asp-Asp) domain-containing protein